MKTNKTLFFLKIFFNYFLPDNTDDIAAIITDTTIDGPVIWAAAWPTIRNMASDQYPDNPLRTKLVISGQVMALNCWTTRFLISSSSLFILPLDKFWVEFV